ncbi:hypothetical protein CFR79_02925 [Komagataeibacter saccharivorans]|nr:hypothetical protein CFR79_02925 [Komagataeibacter saccharivorans]
MFWRPHPEFESRINPLEKPSYRISKRALRRTYKNTLNIGNPHCLSHNVWRRHLTIRNKGEFPWVKALRATATCRFESRSSQTMTGYILLSKNVRFICFYCRGTVSLRQETLYYRSVSNREHVLLNSPAKIVARAGRATTFIH